MQRHHRHGRISRDVATTSMATTEAVMQHLSCALRLGLGVSIHACIVLPGCIMSQASCTSCTLQQRPWQASDIHTQNRAGYKGLCTRWTVQPAAMQQMPTYPCEPQSYHHLWCMNVQLCYHDLNVARLVPSSLRACCFQCLMDRH